MPPARSSYITDKGALLVGAADRLVRRQGFARTTLAHVAAEAGVPLGNVYYYFKTKDALLEALIARRADLQARRRATWGGLAGPRQRLLAFVERVDREREALARDGCPIGSLCQELDKDRGPLERRAARLFTAMLEWLEGQLRLAGHGREAPALALQLLASLQGATLLANALDDVAPIRQECARLRAWVKHRVGGGGGR